MATKREKVRKIFTDKEPKQVKHYTKKKAIGLLSVFSAVLCVLSVAGFLWIRTSFSDVDMIKVWVDNNYVIGIIIMTLICAIQVVIALIPGELLEIASGYAFGSVVGTLVCIVGMVIGSVIAILLARRFGRALVESIYPRDKLEALPIVNDPKKRNVTVFLLFLIPGTPKDMLTYVIGLTSMSIPKYIALTTFARMPSVIMSTIGGHALGEDEFLLALIAFIVTGVVSGCGYLLYLSIQNKHKKKNTDSEDVK